MRDNRFVAIHRGGPLSRKCHHQLIRWARECSEHIISLAGTNIDGRLIYALSVAREWERENATVGEARSAAAGAIAVANESSDEVVVAIARSICHAVATAHMADHSTGAAEYALKAVKLSGGPMEEERKWQDEILHPDISELILSARVKKQLRK